MYCKHFGFTERPFEITPDDKFLYMTRGHREALATLIYGIRERRGFLAMVGDVGTGQITKAANQVIVGLNIGAVAEALTLAKQAGADAARVREALLGGFAASRILEVHGQRMIDGEFKPGGKVVTQYKDLSQAIELAEACGLDLPATRLNRELYRQLIDAGNGELDHSALILALDR